MYICSVWHDCRGGEGVNVTAILPVIVLVDIHHESRQQDHWLPSGCMSGIVRISSSLGTSHPHLEEQYWMTVKVSGSYLRTDGWLHILALAISSHLMGVHCPFLAASHHSYVT